MDGSATNPLADPAVRAAIENAERMTRIEGKVDAILDHSGRTDAHLATLNGRVGRTEEFGNRTHDALKTLLQQREDRQEYSRLVAVEETVSSLKTSDHREAVREEAASKRFVAVVTVLGAAIVSSASKILEALF